MSHIVTYKIYPCEDKEWLKTFRKIKKCIRTRGVNGKILSIDTINTKPRYLPMARFVQYIYTTVIKCEVEK